MAIKPPPPPQQWFWNDNGQARGPMSSQELRSLARVGIVTATTPIRRSGEKKWSAASRVAGLFQENASTAPTPPSPPPPPAGSNEPIIDSATGNAPSEGKISRIHPLALAMPIPLIIGFVWATCPMFGSVYNGIEALLSAFGFGKRGEVYHPPPPGSGFPDLHLNRWPDGPPSMFAQGVAMGVVLWAAPIAFFVLRKVLSKPAPRWPAVAACCVTAFIGLDHWIYSSRMGLENFGYVLGLGLAVGVSLAFFLPASKLDEAVSESYTRTDAPVPAEPTGLDTEFAGVPAYLWGLIAVAAIVMIGLAISFARR